MEKAFCPRCGNEITGESFCSKCGSPVGASQYDTAVARPPTAHYAPDSFIELFHYSGQSVLFLVGIILFSAGKLLAIFASFTWVSIFSMMFLALPVTGFWLIFAASKAPVLPEKTLTALTLFKVSVTVDLVFSCLQGFLFLILSILLFVVAGAGELSSSGVVFISFMGIVFFFAGGVVAALAIIYFRAALKIIGGLKANILNNTFEPLPNLNFFTILTYISVGFGALGALSELIISGAMNSIMSSLPWQLRDAAASYFSGRPPISALFTLTGLMGVVVCVVALNAFNKSLVEKVSALGGGYRY